VARVMVKAMMKMKLMIEKKIEKKCYASFSTSSYMFSNIFIILKIEIFLQYSEFFRVTFVTD
jgi:hypothetical protein